MNKHLNIDPAEESIVSVSSEELEHDSPETEIPKLISEYLYGEVFENLYTDEVANHSLIKGGNFPSIPFSNSIQIF